MQRMNFIQVDMNIYVCTYGCMYYKCCSARKTNFSTCVIYAPSLEDIYSIYVYWKQNIFPFS